MASGQQGGRLLHRVLQRAGYALEEVLDAARRTGGRAVSRAQELSSAGAGGLPDLDDLPQWGSDLGEMVLEDLLEPHPVHWRRALVAGIIGTLLYDAISSVEQRRLERKFGTREAAADEDPSAALGRYAGGVALAGVYGRYIHGRFEGPVIARGLVLGTAAAIADTRQGLLAEVAGAAGLPMPGWMHGPRGPGRLTPGGVTAHLAFGAAVGVIYGWGD
jgi:hypothetical protein